MRCLQTLIQPYVVPLIYRHTVRQQISSLRAAPGMEIQHMLMTPDMGLKLRLQPTLALKQPGVR